MEDADGARRIDLPFPGVRGAGGEEFDKRVYFRLGGNGETDGSRFHFLIQEFDRRGIGGRLHEFDGGATGKFAQEHRFGCAVAAS